MTATNENPEAINPSKDEKIFAMLAHLLAIFTGFLAPLVIWLVKKDESAFVAKHSREALNFCITVCIGFLALFLLSVLFGWIPILGFIVFGLMMLGYFVIGIYALVMFIIATMRANDGLDYEYPISLRLIK